MSPKANSKVVLQQIIALEQYLDSLNIIPATAMYRSTVILALLSKALTVSRAVCVLVDAGYLSEAFASSRTLIDIYFSIRYIGSRDSENRAEKYVRHSARIRTEWKTIIDKYYPSIPPQSLEQSVLDAAAEFPNKGYWAGRGQTKIIALEPDPVEKNKLGQPLTSEFDYDTFYFWTSQFVHPTAESILAHACKRGEAFTIRADISSEEKFGRLSLANVLTFVSKAFISAFRAMNETQPEDKLQEMHKMLSTMGRKTNPGFTA